MHFDGLDKLLDIDIYGPFIVAVLRGATTVSMLRQTIMQALP